MDLLRNRSGWRTVCGEMKAFVAALLCALAVGCAAPSPPVTPSGSPSPSPAASPSITCLSDQTNECPSAIVALEALVARLGPIDRAWIAPGYFECGQLWPGVGSPQTPPPISDTCYGLIPAGFAMHGWASFAGTEKVAAISLDRSPIQPNSLSPAFGPWRATLAAFDVPPSGWTMP
jgi:hypothetical protein